MTVQYIEYHELECRGPVDPAPSEAVEGTLLVGTKVALTFYANQSNYGEDHVSIFPAFHNGVHSWLRREEWCPAEGYSASGTQEFVISFEEGVKLFLEKGVFDFPVPKKDGNLLDLAGTLAFDGEDVADKHDEYLAEVYAKEYDGSNARPHVPSERLVASREAREQRSPRPPRGRH